jgi:hypothetical protein
VQHFFHFKKFITIDVMKFTYVLGLIAIIFIGISFISLGGILNYAIAFGIITIGNLLWRVLCEIVTILFSINKNLEIIRNKKK